MRHASVPKISKMTFEFTPSPSLKESKKGFHALVYYIEQDEETFRKMCQDISFCATRESHEAQLPADCSKFNIEAPIGSFLMILLAAINDDGEQSETYKFAIPVPEPSRVLPVENLRVVRAMPRLEIIGQERHINLARGVNGHKAALEEFHITISDDDKIRSGATGIVAGIEKFDGSDVVKCIFDGDDALPSQEVPLYVYFGLLYLERVNAVINGKGHSGLTLTQYVDLQRSAVQENS